MFFGNWFPIMIIVLIHHIFICLVSEQWRKFAATAIFRTHTEDTDYRKATTRPARKKNHSKMVIVTRVSRNLSWPISEIFALQTRKNRERAFPKTRPNKSPEISWSYIAHWLLSSKKKTPCFSFVECAVPSRRWRYLRVVFFNSKLLRRNYLDFVFSGGEDTCFFPFKKGSRS